MRKDIKMTLGEVLGRIDSLKKNNDYTTEEKIAWINRLESKVIHDIIYKHLRHIFKEPSVLIEESDTGGCTITIDDDTKDNSDITPIGTLYADIPYTADDLERDLVIPRLIRDIDLLLERRNKKYTLCGKFEEESLNELYIDYVCMQIDHYNGEVDRYNNSAARFNAAYEDLKNYYISIYPYTPAPSFRRY